MPAPFIGGQYIAPVPDVEEQIALGYTHIRIYWAPSETGATTLVSTQQLVAGIYQYSYNKTDALYTDWAEHTFYSVANGEGPRSERMPISVAQPLATRLAIRQGVGRKLRLMELVTVASAATASDFTSNDLIDPDASEYRYANWFARVATGARAGDRRRVRAYSSNVSNKGYTASSGKIIVGRAFGGTLSNGDTVELWRPKGDEDPSVMIDEATNRARHALWWEDDTYVVTSDGVSDYVLPGFVEMETQVKRVEYAARDYPSDPQWMPVGRADPRRLAGQVWLTSVEQDALTRQLYPAGSVLKVTVNRRGDVLDSDSDEWDNCPSLEWAIAETAYAFLQTLGSPSGGFEDVLDVKEAREVCREEVARFRRLYLPGVAARVELPK